MASETKAEKEETSLFAHRIEVLVNEKKATTSTEDAIFCVFRQCLESSGVQQHEINLRVLLACGERGIEGSVEDSGKQSSLSVLAGRLFEHKFTADMAKNLILSSTRSQTQSEDEEDDDPLQRIINILEQSFRGKGDNHAKINVTFRLEDDTTLLMQVRERSKSGIVRILWSSSLTPIRNPRPSDQDPSSASRLIDFTSSIVDALHKADDRACQLQKRLKDGEQNRGAWKDTAQKLEGEWEKEKTVLLQNFLKLYNARQDSIKQLENELNEYREKERRYGFRSIKVDARADSIHSTTEDVALYSESRDLENDQGRSRKRKQISKVKDGE